MRVFLSNNVLELLKQPCFVNNHKVDPCSMKCLRCGMWGRLVHQFPCPTRKPMFHELPERHMFMYNDHEHMKLNSHRAFNFATEMITSFAPSTEITPVDSAELKLFKLRVERMVTDRKLVEKIFSHKNIQRIKDLKPGASFTDGVRRYTSLNGTADGKIQAYCSNYFIHKFDPQELVEVVE